MHKSCKYLLAAFMITLGGSESLKAQSFRCPDVKSLKNEDGMLTGVEPLAQGGMGGRMPNYTTKMERLDTSIMKLTELYQIRLYKNPRGYYMDCHYGLTSPELEGESEVYIQHHGQNMTSSSRCTIQGQQDNILVLPCKSPEACEVTCE